MRPFSELREALLAAAFLRLSSPALRTLASGEQAEVDRWTARETPKRLHDAREYAVRALEQIGRAGARVVVPADPEYPPHLRELRRWPAFLIVRGTLVRGGVAVVGSRDAPPEATAFALVFSRALRETIVSGLAAGIDAHAHRGALEAGTPTVAYVAHGLGETYPPEHRELEERIVAAGGGIASERLPGESAVSWALVQRDRLQAAHARAVVLVASGLDGGAMYTMRFAKELGRPRFALQAEGIPHYTGNVRARTEGAIALPFDVAAAVEQLRAAGGK